MLGLVITGKECPLNQAAVKVQRFSLVKNNEIIASKLLKKNENSKILPNYQNTYAKCKSKELSPRSNE